MRPMCLARGTHGTWRGANNGRKFSGNNTLAVSGTKSWGMYLCKVITLSHLTIYWVPMRKPSENIVSWWALCRGWLSNVHRKMYNKVTVPVNCFWAEPGGWSRDLQGRRICGETYSCGYYISLRILNIAAVTALAVVSTYSCGYYISLRILNIAAVTALAVVSTYSCGYYIQGEPHKELRQICRPRNIPLYNF